MTETAGVPRRYGSRGCSGLVAPQNGFNCGNANREELVRDGPSYSNGCVSRKVGRLVANVAPWCKNGVREGIGVCLSPVTG